MEETSFRQWFNRLTGHDSPRDWQGALAAEQHCRDRLVRRPTGDGKSEGVLAAWSFHRLCRAADDWPRRLIWCLPMRVLVEQISHLARQLAHEIPEATRPDVHIVMGGEDVREWFLMPERPAIIIGTQDMLLSRALNRGYASARARWPMEFGLLNQDALWVMDEVQLMDVGLATSAQLQAYREDDREKQFRPCHTWWMSATLQANWLRSVDTARYHDNWIRSPCTVTATERSGGLWDVKKQVVTDFISPRNHAAFAKRILDVHTSAPGGEFGRITLVVCNTVDRACQTFDAMRAAGRSDGLELVHSRFRPAEREAWRERFLSSSACGADVDRIIIATQVVEAGVDISASCLVTELAPWPSLVQRFGRCARYGGSGRVLVVDRGHDKANAAPYSSEELEAAWDTLEQLHDVGIAALETHEAALTPEAVVQLYPYSPSHLLLRKELDELFDTSPDLTGADVDISRFIRSGDERDLQVFWVDLDKDEVPSAKRRAHRRELCAVPFLTASDWLCGEETKSSKKPKLRDGMRAWVWDWIDGEWSQADRASLLPGRVVCIASGCGGYQTDRGFNAGSKEAVPAVSLPLTQHEVEICVGADDQQDSEQLSINPWKTIACHSTEVSREATQIARQLGLSSKIQESLELAARWHDWGKAHPAFQGSVRDSEAIKRLNRMDIAKAPGECWRRSHRYQYLDSSETRPAFRHELASALGLFAILETYSPMHPALLGPWKEMLGRPDDIPASCEPAGSPYPLIQRLLNTTSEAFDLVTYLVASHHGKVRVGLHAAPQDQEYCIKPGDANGLPIRGIREGDRLPEVCLAPGEAPIPAIQLTLSPATMGLSHRTGISWRERCIKLIDQHGPTSLAFLEAILRAADVRASRLTTNDSILEAEVSA